MLLAIINGKVLDGAGHTWDKATVLAENGKIKAVGPDVAVPEGAQVIDCLLYTSSLGPIITRTALAVPAAIFSESFLAYIGLGLRPPEPSIGILLSEGQKVLLYYPTQTLFPAIIISLLCISFNMFGNGLRDAFDPTQRGA